LKFLEPPLECWTFARPNVFSPCVFDVNLRLRPLDALYHLSSGIDVRLRQAGWQETGSKPPYLRIELRRHAEDGEYILTSEQSDGKASALTGGISDGLSVPAARQ